MVSLMMLRHFRRAGFDVIGLVGTATGLVGDPSGKSADRPVLSPEEVLENAAGVRQCIERVLLAPTDPADEQVLEEFADLRGGVAPSPGSVSLVENHTHYEGMSALAFLRDIGRHFRMSTMLARESVKQRMQPGSAGMSFTEFSYQMLQAWDFECLHRDRGCVGQVGGSDQWGNITAGLDLVHRRRGAEAGDSSTASVAAEAGGDEAAGDGPRPFAITCPLVTDASGNKLGKTEGNAVWLDDQTSDFGFYQYFMRMTDEDAGKMLLSITEAPIDPLLARLSEHAAAPERLAAQRELATRVTRLVRGLEAVDSAQEVTEALYGKLGSLGAAAAAGLADAGRAGDVPAVSLPREGDWPLLDLFVRSGLVSSKGEARRLVKAGGLRVNGQPVSGASRLGQEQLLHGEVAMLQRGKAAKAVAFVEADK